MLKMKRDSSDRESKWRQQFRTVDKVTFQDKTQLGYKIQIGYLRCMQKGRLQSHSVSSQHPLRHYHILFFSFACVLSCFSRVRLSATLWTVALQAPLSMKFSRQECWSWFPCPSPGDILSQGLNPGLLHYKQILSHMSYSSVQLSCSVVFNSL